ncbi:TetR/AcrR family transcriptional regulator [Mycolicibacter longobardus]|uniref:Transcriptional regulator n=1 Tax=Mycolicibacter longobardus TaxID=1108812 RepID=A0A1X1YI20_9MYCO|nr:TetR/AcrR family transcriptional regulator [Mycolicibacter longobardus]MCV7385904.1 TetR/AcrR family transcriptional regulator [Mycolicibacter longobardus]ORW10757.1 transcriptional regulator [Mycolicibacter longobardus]
MSTDAASGRGRLPALTGDARSDRWREHRAAVQADLIEATLRAIEKYGPDLSIDDVVKTAEVPRPKLYRFFGDKNTLFRAVAARVQELVIERVVPRFDFAGTAQQMVRSALSAYVDLVDERPNLFRFLVGSHFRDERSATDLIDQGRPLSDATVGIWAQIIAARNGDSRELEYVVDAALGAVALGVLRWLNTPTISKAVLVDQLSTFLWGALSATAAERGVVFNPGEKLLRMN